MKTNAEIKQMWINSVEEIKNSEKLNNKPCLHENCSECHGTGKKGNGESCIHFISCPCPKCNPTF